MSELSIRIKIWDREYPMRVDHNEEANVRKAAKSINDRIKVYRDKFGIDDIQDLLAMVAFECLIESTPAEGSNNEGVEEVIQKVETMNKFISQII